MTCIHFTHRHTRIKWSLDLHACMHDTNINTWKMFRGSNSHLTTHWFPQLVTHWEVDVPTRQKVFKWGKTLICMIFRGTLLTLHTFILPRVAWMSHIQVQIYCLCTMLLNLNRIKPPSLHLVVHILKRRSQNWPRWWRPEMHIWSDPNNFLLSSEYPPK